MRIRHLVVRLLCLALAVVAASPWTAAQQRGGVLQVAGVPVGQALGQYFLKDQLSRASGDGSCIVVIATDAPLSDRNLERLAHRGLLGIARTGSPMTNGSGEYAVAFSTNLDVRRTAERRATPSSPSWPSCSPRTNWCCPSTPSTRSSGPWRRTHGSKRDTCAARSWSSRTERRPARGHDDGPSTSDERSIP